MAFSDNPQISNFMKAYPVRAELSHADGQTWQSQYSLSAMLWMHLKTRHIRIPIL